MLLIGGLFWIFLGFERLQMVSDDRTDHFGGIFLVAVGLALLALYTCSFPEVGWTAMPGAHVEERPGSLKTEGGNKANTGTLGLTRERVRGNAREPDSDFQRLTGATVDHTTSENTVLELRDAGGRPVYGHPWYEPAVGE